MFKSQKKWWNKLETQSFGLISLEKVLKLTPSLGLQFGIGILKLGTPATTMRALIHKDMEPSQELQPKLQLIQEITKDPTTSKEPQVSGASVMVSLHKSTRSDTHSRV